MAPLRSSRCLAVVLGGALTLASCGGGSDAGGVSGGDVDDGVAASNETESAADIAIETAADASTDTARSSDDVVDLLADRAIDPVFHHVSADAPAGSWGPLCNPVNQDDWAPGWRISVPETWTFWGSSGGSSSYDISFNTPDGPVPTVAWADSVASSQAYSGGTPVGEVDFDGETVTIVDHSDDVNQILSMDYTARSAGGWVEALGGEPIVQQVAVTTPVEMGFSPDDATAILLSMRFERCAVFDALQLEYAYNTLSVVPLFEGGDPLGKEAPAGERLPYDVATALTNPYSGYTDAQLAYIVGYDQATSECFVDTLRSLIPTDQTEQILFDDPITPQDEVQVAAMESILAQC